jgi:hypothetical protein
MVLCFTGCAFQQPTEQQWDKVGYTGTDAAEDSERDKIPKDGKIHPYFQIEPKSTIERTYWIGIKGTFW